MSQESHLHSVTLDIYYRTCEEGRGKYEPVTQKSLSVEFPDIGVLRKQKVPLLQGVRVLVVTADSISVVIRQQNKGSGGRRRQEWRRRKRGTHEGKRRGSMRETSKDGRVGRRTRISWKKKEEGRTYIFFAKQLFLWASHGILQYVLFGLSLIHLSQLAHKTLFPSHLSAPFPSTHTQNRGQGLTDKPRTERHTDLLSSTRSSLPQCAWLSSVSVGLYRRVRDHQPRRKRE